MGATGMIGILVVAHGNIGREMVDATKRIIPDVKHLYWVSVESDDPPEQIRQQISEGIKKATHDEGRVLILTDMFGGTPSNICLSFLKSNRIEIISGFNLPMLIKLANLSNDKKFNEIANFIKEYGQKNIVIAGDVLKNAKNQSKAS